MDNAFERRSAPRSEHERNFIYNALHDFLAKNGSEKRLAVTLEFFKHFFHEAGMRNCIYRNNVE